MSHYRSAYRAAARAALEARPEFADCEQLQAWVASLDGAALPAMVVSTPSETAAPIARGQAERRSALVVFYACHGGQDIEDRLDELSALIEPLVLGALRPLAQVCHLEETGTSVSAADGKRVGTLTMRFSLKSWRP